MEQLIGRLLQMGVLLATAVVLTGGAMLIATHGGTIADFRVFRGESSTLRSVSAAARGAFTFDPRGMVQLGLVLLIATPVARVAFSVVAFALQRDGRFVLITLIVLAALLYSLAAS